MKILVIRFSSIGDIVLTTPVVRCLKLQLGAEVHYLTKPAFHDLLRANPYIDRVHLLGDSLMQTIDALRSEQYDVVIDLHHNLRTFIVKVALGKPSYSFNKLNIEKWLMVQWKVNRLPPIHITTRYLDTCASLGVKDDQRGMDYYIAPQDEVDIATLPIAFHQGYIAWVIGAKQGTKQFPADKIVEVMGAATFPHLPIVLIGGKEDMQTAQAIVDTAPPDVLIFNVCGQYGLGGSASLIKQAILIIANDTGMMHIAAALQRPVVCIWGNTIPEFGMYSYYGAASIVKSENVQVSHLNCRPCSKLGYASCPKGHHHCMRQINSGQVIEAIKAVGSVSV